MVGRKNVKLSPQDLTRRPSVLKFNVQLSHSMHVHVVQTPPTKKRIKLIYFSKATRKIQHFC